MNTQTQTEDDVDKQRKNLFIKPLKAVFLDLAICFILNLIMLYAFLFLIPDSSVAMLGIIWVILIAWRGGVFAGVIGSVAIYLSNALALHIPPHMQISLTYFFNGKIPGFVIGYSQTLAGALIVGYISMLVHQLRDEISLRKKVQADLEQKVAELNTFGHTVAHDLKNPLMIINMAITTIAKELADSGNRKTDKMIGFIQTSATNMVNIIESLLTFAGIRIMDDKEYRYFSLSECVNAALHRLAYNIEGSHVHLKMPDAWPSPYGHAPWITEVLVNYINNAIKYGGNASMGTAPEIELGYDLPGSFSCSNSDHARFWVKDNGEGIPEDRVQSLFREFSRLHSSKHEGHGLGLSIVKSVIDRLGGTVGMVPNKTGGSCFFFTLPVKSSTLQDGVPSASSSRDSVKIAK